MFQFGLQGKLIVSFLALISVCLGSSCWLFMKQSNDQITDLIGEQARLVAYTLSRAAEPSLAGRKNDELRDIGQGLLKARNILYVAFLDADRRPIALANRYVDFSWKNVNPISKDVMSLYRVHPRSSQAFGEYVDVFAPVMARRLSESNANVLGYVSVGVSLDHELSQMQMINWIVAGIGITAILFCIPVAYLLVFSIFKPIRQLVDATKKMAVGRLDIELDISRPDLIGDLAVSFQEMVFQVGQQREDLASTNAKLANANNALASANSQLAVANQDLEQKVHLRTSQLEKANTRLSAEIAEKEDFLRAVSHDLNAPLRNIAGMTSMLLSKNQGKFEPDVVHRLERISKNVQVESELISELLELSRIKSRREKPELVDVEALIKDIGDVFEQDLSSRQIRLIMDTPIQKLTAERARIRQVFQNLIDNAIKYMGDRPIREIHVGCTARIDETLFYVRDTGIGIDADDLGKVFNVFRRGKSAAIQKIDGKGVGLASVKSIIETYSGTIWVESKVDEGTTFFFTINGKHAVSESSNLTTVLQENRAA